LPYKFTSFSIIITQAVSVCDGSQNNVIRVYIEWCQVALFAQSIAGVTVFLWQSTMPSMHVLIPVTMMYFKQAAIHTHQYGYQLV